MPSQNKRDVDAVVHPTEEVYVFTSTETGETYAVPIYVETVLVDCSSYTCTITLPNESECRGMTKTVRILSGTEECTIADKAGNTLLGCEDTGDYLIVRSDGSDWNIVESSEAD